MLIKSAEDRDSDIKILESLLNHPAASALTKRSIEKEIRAIKAGVKGEKDAAYQIEYHYGHGKTGQSFTTCVLNTWVVLLKLTTC